MKLSMLVARYDRSAPLLDGEVSIPGIELEVTADNDDTRRQRAGLSGRFDVWEAYAGRYLLDREAGWRDYVAIPVFPKRAFRHGSIYIRRDGSVSGPVALRGRRVGVQHWSTTAAIWAKGILAEEHGVDLDSIDWIQTSPDELPWNRPVWLRLDQAPVGSDLATLLREGTIDAAITSQAWVPYEHPDFTFLLPDYPDRERAYFRQTGIFPIMHVLLVRSAILDADPSVGPRLFAAWTEAKERCYERMERECLVVSSMWFQGLLEEERTATGARDTYPYGLRRSRHEFAKLIDLAVAQGLLPAARPVEAYFHPATLEL